MQQYKWVFQNCYGIAILTHNSGYDVGGITRAQFWITNIEMNNCYFAGSVEKKYGRMSTFVGGCSIKNNNNMNGTGVLTNCFYDKTKFTFEVSPSGTGLTTDEMKNAANYTGTNEDGTKAWDFKESDSDTDYTWYIDPNVNDGYPELHF